MSAQAWQYNEKEMIEMKYFYSYLSPLKYQSSDGTAAILLPGFAINL